ncbi:hypothetical protein [Desulforhabdus sp. TSK]|uniref:hypothetical protein n=1 Tax=Desulforhabdus sp. TSK TaxID=2925014 RepID=UPI001FC7E07B|nr:hypothetical protein [Desulforhabdus sp. TSK]GKT09622.1 hypothetical protein DSTSK_29270 [Desulforhabdus sp. TSK]
MAVHTKIVDPNGGGDYTSLSAWEAGQQTLYSSGDTAVADCRRTGSAFESTSFTIAGWTSGVNIRIIANSSYRHEGKWANQQAGGNYVVMCSNTGSKKAAITISQSTANNILIQGIVFDAPGNWCIDKTSAAPILTVEGCILNGGGRAGTRGIYANSNSIFINNILHDIPESYQQFPQASKTGI